jgi:hypothetical protein
MTTVVPAAGGFLAFYVGADKKWRVARNALGHAIVCETFSLAQSVARYRRRRLRSFR